MKKLAILPVLALAALTATACGKKDSDDAAGGADTTAVPATDTTGMAPSAMPPAAPMATDSMHGGMTDSTGGAGAPGTNQQDTLIKVDSLKKKP
ncbi:MAG: hypothetical protein JO306_04225 [Gemmatimonadetes bacterium]|nr:hypothetical protein [Gemmatimonadota bacterium]